MVRGGAALARDDVARGVSLGDREQFLLERVGDRRGNGGEWHRAKSSTVFHDVAADQPEAHLVIAFGAHVEPGMAAISAIGEHSIECRAGVRRSIAAVAPNIELWQQDRLGAQHRHVVVHAERFGRDRTSILARPCR